MHDPEMTRMPQMVYWVEWKNPEDEMLGIGVRAQNELFSGVGFFRCWGHQLAELAQLLYAFPSQPGDERSVQPPLQEPIWLGLKAIDSRGHCVATITIVHESGDRAQVRFAVEPAAIDRFLAQVKSMARSGQGTAVLEGSSC